MSNDYLKNIAIVGVRGAGGLGKHLLAALVGIKRFQLTAVSRTDSSSTFPDSVKVVRGSYEDEEFLVQSFTNQDALIISLGFLADPAITTRMFKAAAKANVPFLLPTEFGSDGGNPKMVETNPALQHKAEHRRQIEELGVSSWIGISNNPFYGWSLVRGLFKIDVKSRKATLYDNGLTKFSTSSFSTIATSVAKFLSLPINASSSGELNLSQFRNRFAYISTFRLNQREMLDAVQKVTGTTDADWTIENESASAALERAHEQFKQNPSEVHHMIDLLYISHFVEGLGGDFVPTKGNIAEQLDVPQEDLVEETAKAIASMGETALTLRD